MSTYRQIHTKIWKDSWFLELEPEYKLLFIYLFSNERVNLVGLYDLSPRVIAFETGLPPDTVLAGMEHFQKTGKVMYEDGWLWIRNLLRYNAVNITSPKIQKHLETVLDSIPDIPLKQACIRYYTDSLPAPYGINRVSIPNRTEQEQEQEQEQDTEHDTEQEQETDGIGSAAAAWYKLTDGKTNQFQLDDIDILIQECAEHVATLPRGSPGADLSGDDWVALAIREAGRSTPEPGINYVTSILHRWFKEGLKAPKDARGKDGDRKRFIQGEYAEIVEH